MVFVVFWQFQTRLALGQSQIRKERKNHVASGALPFAMREVRTTFTDPRSFIVLAGVGVAVGLSGPFETFALMPTLPRIAYWTALVFVTYATGNFVSAYVQFLLRRRITHPQWRNAVAGIAIGPPVFVVIAAMNYASFGLLLTSPSEILAELVIITTLSVLISVIMGQFAAPEDATPQPPAILDRLPFDKRGALVALSVDDHYVSVVTTKGQEMVLMRMADAMKETGDVAGMQVHRSHWVALDQIASVKRSGDRAVLTLRTGGTVPVSRSYMPAVRDAGLLRRSSHG